MLRKETRAIVREAERQGWRVEVGGGGHLTLYAPDGEGVVTVAATPSDYRSLENSISDLRKHGFQWKGR